MSQKIENARDILLARGRAFLLQNQDGHLGKFNVRSLTAECGMASGTFYHYFTCKDDLVLQIMEDDWEKILQALPPLAARKLSLYEKLKVIYEMLRQFEHCYRYSAMGLLQPTKENIAVRERNEKKLYDLIQNFLHQEVQLGEIELTASIESAAYLLVQLLLATGRNPKISFDDLWNCMNFKTAN